MPTPRTLESFIARVESNAHVEAIEEFYTEHATMQRWEGDRIAQEQFFHDPKQFARPRS